MSVAKLKKIFYVFEDEVQDALQLVRNVENLVGTLSASSPKLSQTDLNKITELSFIKLFLAWEKFLQNALLGCIMFKRQNTKFCCYIRPKDTEHALDILKEGREYADFSNINFVLRIANNYFRNGKPFREELNLCRSDLDDIKTIRNVIVHISDKSKENFKALVRRQLGTATRGTSPGKFLLTMAPGGTTFLTSYSNTLKDVANRIIF